MAGYLFSFFCDDCVSFFFLIQTTSTDTSPLHYYCFHDFRLHNRDDVIIAFHELKGDGHVTSLNHRGETALSFAAMGSASALIMTLLLSHGADPEQVDQSGVGVRETLLFHGHSESASILNRFTESYKTSIRSKGPSLLTQLDAWSKETHRLSTFIVLRSSRAVGFMSESDAPPCFSLRLPWTPQLHRAGRRHRGCGAVVLFV